MGPIRAIKTKYLGYTNTKPTRIKASAGMFMNLTISTSNLTGNTEEMHATVAARLARTLGWLTPVTYLIGGSYENDFYFVLSDSRLIAKEPVGEEP